MSWWIRIIVAFFPFILLVLILSNARLWWLNKFGEDPTSSNSNISLNFSLSFLLISLTAFISVFVFWVIPYSKEFEKHKNEPK